MAIGDAISFLILYLSKQCTDIGLHTDMMLEYDGGSDADDGTPSLH